MIETVQSIDRRGGYGHITLRGVATDDRDVFVGAEITVHAFDFIVTGTITAYSVDREMGGWPLATTPTGKLIIDIDLVGAMVRETVPA